MKAIMYHYVRPDELALPYFRHLHNDDFAAQLDHLASTHRLVTKSEFRQAVESHTPIPRGVVLTFDDGFRDHYLHVLPELRRRGCWGFFYVPTSPYLTGQLLDVHRVHLLLGKWGGEIILRALHEVVSDDMLSHAHVEEFRRLTYRTQSNDDATNLVKRTFNYYIGYTYRSQVLNQLMSRFFPDERKVAEHYYLSLDQIRDMHRAGMEIGSHTVHHPVMSKLAIAEQQREITESFEFIKNVVGRLEWKTFCYPYGGFHSFTLDTERLLEEAGCLVSFNVEPRDIGKEDLASRRQALPRYDCNQFPHGACRAVALDTASNRKLLQ